MRTQTELVQVVLLKVYVGKRKGVKRIDPVYNETFNPKNIHDPSTFAPLPIDKVRKSPRFTTYDAYKILNHVKGSKGTVGKPIKVHVCKLHDQCNVLGLGDIFNNKAGWNVGWCLDYDNDSLKEVYQLKRYDHR